MASVDSNERHVLTVDAEVDLIEAASAPRVASPPDAATRYGLSVVLPAFNEEAVIERTVRSCIGVLTELAPDFEVIVVDDGSRDRTGEIADQLAAEDPRIRVVHNRPNRGYGGALKAGFIAVRKDMTFIMDADGQFDIRDIAALLNLREAGVSQAVLGYREHRRDSFIRLVNARAWNALVSLLFGLRVRDVDCAFKLIDTELVRLCDIQSGGAVISTELLVKLSKLGIQFAEISVRHYPRMHGSATGADLRVILRALRDLLRLRRTLRAWTVEPCQHATDSDTQ